VVSILMEHPMVQCQYPLSTKLDGVTNFNKKDQI
jgi:hypothetical protein